MIDYNILHESTIHYSDYQRIETPWTVTEAISGITKPDDKIDFKLEHNGKVLVASGEQSFLYLYLKGFLPKGKFQTITPCFRHESFDFLHSKYFMKNELINTFDTTEASLNDMVERALSFFGRYLQPSDLYVDETDIGYDIMHNGIELGSYGIRECDFLKWVYGTGVAEPRFSNIVKKAEPF